MNYTATIKYPKSHLDAYALMFDYGEKELIEYGIPRLENIKTWTAKFENGYEADIKLNASEDDVWSEAVLFDGEGYQLCGTEVCDTLEGKWEFEFEGDTYEVELIGVNTNDAVRAV